MYKSMISFDEVVLNECLRIKNLLLDDGSPTSTNLGNDHGLISEEY